MVSRNNRPQRHSIRSGYAIRTLLLMAGSTLLLHATDLEVVLPVYKDRSLQLIWQDQPYQPQDQIAYDNDSNSTRVGEWSYAHRYCQNLKIGNLSSWRLPSKEELYQSYKEQYPFKNSNRHSYWTLTPAEDEEAKHYAIYFKTGDIEVIDDSVHYYIRCVHEMR